MINEFWNEWLTEQNPFDSTLLEETPQMPTNLLAIDLGNWQVRYGESPDNLRSFKSIRSLATANPRQCDFFYNGRYHALGNTVKTDKAFQYFVNAREGKNSEAIVVPTVLKCILDSGLEASPVSLRMSCPTNDPAKMQEIKTWLEHKTFTVTVPKRGELTIEIADVEIRPETNAKCLEVIRELYPELADKPLVVAEVGFGTAQLLVEYEVGESPKLTVERNTGFSDVIKRISESNKFANSDESWEHLAMVFPECRQVKTTGRNKTKTTWSYNGIDISAEVEAFAIDYVNNVIERIYGAIPDEHEDVNVVVIGGVAQLFSATFNGLSQSGDNVVVPEDAHLINVKSLLRA